MIRTALMLAASLLAWEGAGWLIAWWGPGGGELLLQALAVILLLGPLGRLADASHEENSHHG